MCSRVLSGSDPVGGTLGSQGWLNGVLPARHNPPSLSPCTPAPGALCLLLTLTSV